MSSGLIEQILPCSQDLAQQKKRKKVCNICHEYFGFAFFFWMQCFVHSQAVPIAQTGDASSRSLLKFPVATKCRVIRK